MSNPCLAGIHADALRNSAIGRVAKILISDKIGEYKAASRSGIESK